MAPRLIALCGPIGSGKSEVAKHLGSYVHPHFVRVRFAGPLKSMLKALGLRDSQLDGEEKELPSPLLCGRTPRWAMQTLGTEWGRGLIHQDLWTTLWEHRVTAEWSLGNSVVTDDLRFPNEEELVRKLGGQIWRITRPNKVSPGGDYRHPSEAYSPNPDHEIDNCGTIQDLHEMVQALLEAQ